MPELSVDAQKKVFELKKAYIESFPSKIKQLELCWLNIKSSLFAQSELEALRVACHKIAGSSGSYELLEISHAAFELEQLCSFEYLVNQSKVIAEFEIEKNYQSLVRLMKKQVKPREELP